jgi:hypothetical protein
MYKGINKTVVKTEHKFNGVALMKYQFNSILQKCLAFSNVSFHICSHLFMIGSYGHGKSGVEEEIITRESQMKIGLYL